MLLASRRAGFSDRELVAAGLASRARGEGRTYDRFRRRIMFPLCDARGRVLGFGARAVGEEQQPKYLNSSDGPIYHKGRHLFGADIARAYAARAGSVIVAEGYTDVIAMHQAGLRNTVGLMGTALTEEQVGELARLAPTVALALDADSAGQEAMLRAARVAAGRKLAAARRAAAAGRGPRRPRPGRGREGGARRVDASVPFVRFRVERELDAGDLSTAEGKDRVIDALRPVFAGSRPARCARSCSRSWPTAPTSPRRSSPRGWRGRGASAPRARRRRRARRHPGACQPARPAPRLSTRPRAERAFLARCVALPRAGREALVSWTLTGTSRAS